MLNRGHRSWDSPPPTFTTGRALWSSRGTGLVVLQFEELEELGPVARGGDHVQDAAGVGKDHAGGIGIEQLDAPLGQRGEEVKRVELIDEGVGELDETRASLCSLVMVFASTVADRGLADRVCVNHLRSPLGGCAASCEDVAGNVEQ